MNARRILHHLMVLASGQVASWLLSLVSVAIMGRYLGAKGLGQLTVATAYVSIFGIVVGLGMDTVIVRQVARSADGAGHLAGAAVVLRALLTIPALFLLLVVLWLVHAGTDLQVLVAIVLVGQVFGQIGGIAQAIFRGSERMRLWALWNVGFALGTLILTLVAVWLRGSIVLFAAMGTVVQVTLCGLSLYWLRGIAPLRLGNVSRRDVRELAVASLPTWGSTVFASVYSTMDSIILSLLAGTQAVGYYAPAARFFTVVLFAPSLVGQATLPLLARLGADRGGVDFRRVSRKTLGLLVLVAAPLSVGLVTVAPAAVGLLYGPSYGPAIPTLIAITFAIAPMFVNMQFAQMLIAQDQPGKWTRITAVCCVLNPALSATLVPLCAVRWHNAAMGQALALVATEMIMTVYGVVLLRAQIYDTALVRTVVGALIAGAIQAGVVIVLGMTIGHGLAPTAPAALLRLFVSETLGLAAFGVMALVLGAVPRDDAAAIAAAAQAILRRRGGPTANVA